MHGAFFHGFNSHNKKFMFDYMEEIMSIAIANIGQNIMFVFGGLALFLYGINLMSDSLKAAAGNKLKTIIEKTTNTPLKGIIVGILLTVLVQSSSGTTALTIGLLRAGLMTLPQSVGIIMGANIGTTVTAFIIGLPIAKFGYIFLGFGVIMSFVGKKRIHHIGGVLTGLGMLFVGLEVMGSGLKPLASTEQAEQMFAMFSQNWFLGTIFGTLFTAIVQSSSAAIGILEKLYALNAEGVNTISLAGVIPILLGANIGTTITAFLASLGGNTESKRAAFVHVLFNMLMAIVFLIILVPYQNFIVWFELRFLERYSMLSVAFAHLFQNLTMTFILYFFIKHMIRAAKHFIKDKDKKHIPEHMFDEKIIQESPSLALEVAKRGILSMGAVIKEYFDIVRSYSFIEDEKLIEEGYTHEMITDTYDIKLHDFLIKISMAGLNREDSAKLSRDLDTIKDFERIGDHLTNVLEFFKERYQEKQMLSEEGTKDLFELYTVLGQMLDDTLESFKNQDITLAQKVVKTEDLVDELEEKFRYRYIERLKNLEITFVRAANYPDILANLERIGDHLMNIVSSVIEPMYIPQSIIVPKPHELDKDV